MNFLGKCKTPEQLSAKFQTICLVTIIMLVYLCVAPYILYLSGRVFSFWLYFVNIIIVVSLALCMTLFCIGWIIYHLFICWKWLTWRSRLIRLLVCICLAIIPVCSVCIPGYNPAGSAYTIALRTQILNKKPNISVIREWMASVDILSETNRTEIDVQTAPHFIKQLKPDRVIVNNWHEHNEKLSFRAVEFSWRAFLLVVMEIGPPEMPIPNGHEVWTIAPGAYIYFQAK